MALLRKDLALEAGSKGNRATTPGESWIILRREQRHLAKDSITEKVTELCGVHRAAHLMLLCGNSSEESRQLHSANVAFKGSFCTLEIDQHFMLWSVVQ